MTPGAPSSLSSRSRAITLALAGGLILALAGPPVDFVLGAWLGPALFYAALRAEPPAATARRGLRGAMRRAASAGAVGMAFGFACNAATFRFVPDVIVRFTPLPWIAGALAVVLLAAAHALRFYATELVFRAAALRAGLPRPLSFAAAMYAGTFVPMIFPWTTGGAAAGWPITVQIAELVGERGAAAVFALVSALAVEAAVALVARERPRAWAWPLAVAIAIAGALLAYGHARMTRIEAERAAAPRAKVALVQPSIEARERWEKGRARAILEKLSALTREAEAAGAELVIWPEAAYPYSLSRDGRRAPVGTFAPLQHGVRGPVLMGALTHHDADREARNSAVVAYTDGTLSEPYHKIHLLWFGETVPLADVWPWLRRTFARGVGLTPGDRQLVLPAGPVRAAVLNCFEDTLPAAGREAASVSPNVLVNVTNDAWFAGSHESALHLRVASMRSIETRRDMIRAVNYGPTSWVDASGRVRARLDPPVPGFLMTEPALLERPLTPYARFGDAPTAALLGAIAAVAAARRRRRSAG